MSSKVGFGISGVPDACSERWIKRLSSSVARPTNRSLPIVHQRWKMMLICLIILVGRYYRTCTLSLMYMIRETSRLSVHISQTIRGNRTGLRVSPLQSTVALIPILPKLSCLPFVVCWWWWYFLLFYPLESHGWVPY